MIANWGLTELTTEGVLSCCSSGTTHQVELVCICMGLFNKFSTKATSNNNLKKKITALLYLLCNHWVRFGKKGSFLPPSQQQEGIGGANAVHDFIVD